MQKNWKKKKYQSYLGKQQHDPGNLYFLSGRSPLAIILPF
jgi:hypothetical protein